MIKIFIYKEKIIFFIININLLLILFLASIINLNVLNNNWYAEKYKKIYKIMNQINKSLLYLNFLFNKGNVNTFLSI